LDILEIRLNSLAPYVDKFVLCESPLTFSHKLKPLYFQENKERFKDFNVQGMVYESQEIQEPWERGWNQLRYLIDNLDCDPEDMLIVCDGDEIPNLKDWGGQEGIFVMERYYYRLNGSYNKGGWLGGDAVLRKNANDIKDIRWHRNPNLRNPNHHNYNRIPNGGWHFACLGSAEDILYKFECNAHQELVTPEFFEQIRKNTDDRFHPLYKTARENRRPRRMVTKMPSGPEWLLQNKDKYKHLFWED
jgi:beta-1,4-mannosyl-glycoprotein beta-1,4-N-acetylglucosaminyltransferase